MDGTGHQSSLRSKLAASLSLAAWNGVWRHYVTFQVRPFEFIKVIMNTIMMNVINMIVMYTIAI